MPHTFYELQPSLPGWLHKIISRKIKELGKQLSQEKNQNVDKGDKLKRSLPPIPNFFQRLKNPNSPVYSTRPPASESANASPANESANKESLNRIRLIAEYKRRSPSDPVLAKHSLSSMLKVYGKYAQAISILCDPSFFGGSLHDLQQGSQRLLMNKGIAAADAIPLLCKEFILTPQQILWAREHGASAVLLMASVLSPRSLREATAFAQELELTPLIEIHTKEEWEIVQDIPTKTIGINNRHLSDLSVDIYRATEILERIPEGYLRIIESGARTRADVEIYETIADAFLIGTAFMRAADPEKKIHELGWQKVAGPVTQAGQEKHAGPTTDAES